MIYYLTYPGRCTCGHYIGQYLGLVNLLLDRPWPEIMQLLQIEKPCCMLLLQYPYARQFNWQLPEVVEGLVEVTKVPPQDFDFMAACQNVVWQHALPEQPPLSGTVISVEETTIKEPIYTGRPERAIRTVPPQTREIRVGDAKVIQLERLAMTYTT